MLKQLECDCFKKNGKKREPIVLKKGLNVISGTSLADNSIGKSTFLFAIDFCFGGESYIKQKFPENLKNQTFKFIFEFDNTDYFFERDTINPNVVSKCDAYFNKKEDIPLNEFRKFLFNNYKINLHEISFREMIGVYVRIFGLDTCSVETPLHIVKSKKVEDVINVFIKLFGKYDTLKEINDEIIKVKERKDTYNKARKLNYIPNAITKEKEYKESMLKIDEYKKELEEITFSQDKELISIDNKNTSEACFIKQNLKNLYRQKKRLLSKKSQIDTELSEINESNNDDYNDLLEFFPNVDIKRISLVDNYHKKLHVIINEEMQKEANSLSQAIEIIENEIKNLEENLRKLNIPISISLDFLKKYSNKENQINYLNKQLKAFEESKSLENKLKELKTDLNEKKKSILETIENSINQQIKIYNDYICLGEKNTPKLLLPDGNHYTLETYTDEGAGTAYKNLIIFDLSVLKQTALPILIHDNYLFKNIGDETLEKIIKLYKTECSNDLSEKQIFIAFDKATAFSKDLQDILTETEVIVLGKNGNELFGYSWA